MFGKLILLFSRSRFGKKKTHKKLAGISFLILTIQIQKMEKEI